MNYKVELTRHFAGGEYTVTGPHFSAVFSGPDAKATSNRYVAWLNAQEDQQASE